MRPKLVAVRTEPIRYVLAEKTKGKDMHKILLFIKTKPWVCENLDAGSFYGFAILTSLDVTFMTPSRFSSKKHLAHI